LIFDSPSLGAVASYLRAKLVADEEEETELPVFADLSRLESDLSSTVPDRDTRESITRRLQAILSNWIENLDSAEQEADIEFQSAPLDEVFAFLDGEDDLL
jgi:hypothetical protein